MKLRSSRMHIALVGALVAAATFIQSARAVDPAHAPVAVRWWGQAFFTIETWWGLTVAIDPYNTQRTGYADPEVAADLVLTTHTHGDHNNPDIVRGAPFIMRGLDANGAAQSFDLILDRRPNESAPKLVRSGDGANPGPHPVRIRAIPAWHDDANGQVRGANTLFLIETDGVRILHCGDLGQTSLTPKQLEAIGAIDVLLIPVGGRFTIDGAAAASVTRQLNPRFVVPMHYKTPDLTIDLADASAFVEAMGDSRVRTAVGNTLAVAVRTEDEEPGTKVVQLDYTPWQPPQHLADGLDRIAEAREALAELIEQMTPAQLDHRPSNGTHTVRWNAEHTAGAEMIFATIVFRDADPTFPLVRISPAQQPADYTPNHPDWSAAEEAAHMRRVGEFVERFAYLLDGVDPNEERYPVFFKSLNGLYELLANHYRSHHESVLKKFELEDWPGN